VRVFRSFRPSAIVAVVAGLAAVAVARPAAAAVKVPALFGDHMVVQAGQPVRLWGTASGGEAIRATLAGREAATRAEADGRWKVTLPAIPPGGPHELVIVGAGPGAGSGAGAGSTALRFTDVWAGEVWLASGQSNMEFPLWRSTGGADAARGGCAGLRLFTVAHATAAVPRDDVEGTWQPCDAEKAAAFSGVAFHFGREIHRALGVPVGIIHASWGGTPAEAWTPRAALVAETALRPMVETYEKQMNDPALRAQALRALADWEARNFHQDTGNKGEARGFARVDAPSAGWKEMNVPGPWEDAGGLKIDGAVWFRRDIDLPADWAGQDVALSLGAIDDFDVTYWNGTRVGAIGADTPQYWSAPRRYVIPGALVRAGRNAVAVRVFDHYGSGGFTGPADALTVRRAAGGDALPLAGRWRYRIERNLKPIAADFSKRPRVPGADDFNSPTVLWNGMIAPAAGLPLAGVIWYQGESNVARASEYRTLFPAMIRGWRSAWGAPALPFLFAQLPNFAAAGAATAPLGQSDWAELRDAQAGALRLPATGMAVTIDVGERDDIHPRNKHDVGRRLALAALAGIYKRDVIASGPRFASAARAAGALRLRFTNVASGLLTADGAAPKGFLLAGADRVWHAADAAIDGDTVVLSSRDVPEPVAARYAWGNAPAATLMNQADLPAAPFRTDDWPAVETKRDQISAQK
jgi:sialate O-acetylesterase